MAHASGNIRTRDILLATSRSSYWQEEHAKREEELDLSANELTAQQQTLSSIADYRRNSRKEIARLSHRLLEAERALPR